MNQIRLYDLFRRELHLSDDKAAEAVYAMQEIAESAMVSKKDSLATKEDIYSLKSEVNFKIQDIYRAIYLSGILQFIALTASFLAIVKFMKP